MPRFVVLIVGNKTVYVNREAADGASMLDMPERRDAGEGIPLSRRPTEPRVRNPFEDDLED